MNGFASNKENRNIDNPSLTLSVECPNDDEFRSGTHEFVNEETYNSNSSNDNNNNDDNTIMKNIFTTEEIELFERRFKEGYDLYIDEKYVDWMNRTYPNFLPAHLRKNSSCISDYIPQSVSEEVEVCTTSSSEHRSHTEIPSYNTDVVPIEENKISKYLTIPKLPQKPNIKEQTGARIVTSYEFLAELQEKEEKKKQVEEEKIQWKLERERRKKKQKRKKQ